MVAKHISVSNEAVHHFELRAFDTSLFIAKLNEIDDDNCRFKDSCDIDIFNTWIMFVTTAILDNNECMTTVLILDKESDDKRNPIILLCMYLLRLQQNY